MSSVYGNMTTKQEMPRAEYPRPDWQRKDWLNLNGLWQFRFDQEDQGLAEEWFLPSASPFTEEIVVPFSWSSPLSGIHRDCKGVAWYKRSVHWKPLHDGERLILRFGAVDYRCDVWINGEAVGTHIGGYGTFEFDVTAYWNGQADNLIVVRVQDNDEGFQTRGKQGYGEIRGIWQTVWLEARPQNYIVNARFITRMDGTVNVSGIISANQPSASTLRFRFADNTVSHDLELPLSAGENEFQAVFRVGQPQLWSPETPYLYEGTIELNIGENFSPADSVSTYFGIREISTVKYNDRGYRWIALNGKPVFLNGTLDQSYNPEGHFTFPSDQFIRDEIWRLKRLGLNLVRIHIKPEEPRKLYWADKLGVLVMEDMVNFWGEPDEQARAAYERELHELLQRDFNHPSIVSWVVFNETWGLFTDNGSGKKVYTPETQEWVRQMYRWVKEQDPTRLVEDNSPCHYDHVESDLNTWHFYTNGYEAVRNHIQDAVDKTYPGSEWNFIGGNKQGDEPLMNSECGAVWGIEGSAGDSDIAWHYRYMMNEFRRHDKMCGFIFTEFHDVINEFNGYYRMDRGEKAFGYEEFCPGMSLRDLHSPDFVVIDAPPCRTVQPDETVSVSLLASSYSDQYHGKAMKLSWELWFDHFGEKRTVESGGIPVEWDGYGVRPLTEIKLKMPSVDAVAVLAVTLRTADGQRIMSNFVSFDVQSGEANGLYDLEGQWIAVQPKDYTAAQFDYSWKALEDHKVNGGTSGFIEYEIKLPDSMRSDTTCEMEILLEAGAKRVLDKDKEMLTVNPSQDLSYMLGAKRDPGMNLNSYFMTDEQAYSSLVEVAIDGESIGSLVLLNDPADSRGVLSWHYQNNDRKLDEAGSYGYLQHIRIPSRIVPWILDKGCFTLRLSVPRELPAGFIGGLAIYGRNAGHYPMDIIVRSV